MGDAPVEPAQPVDYAAADRGWRARRALGAVVSLVVLLGAAAFAFNALADDDNTPEAAVRELLEAASRTDTLGVLGALDPGERDALRGPLGDLVDELTRLRVLRDASLREISGIELDIDGLELSSKRVADDLAHVRVTGGTASYTVRPSDLPLGSFVRDLAGDALTGAEPTSGSDELTFDAKESPIVTVKRGGRWFVSIGYSVAESARVDAGVAIGDLGRGVPARGAASPEQAVDDLVRSTLRLDVRRLIELLPPDELPALHVYARLFIGDAEREVAGTKGVVAARVDRLDLDADVSGDRALVKVRRFTGSIDVAGIHVALGDDRCVTVAMDEGAPPTRLCGDGDPAGVLGELGLPTPSTSVPVPKLSTPKPDIGFVVTRVDDAWYVSPTRTWLDLVTGTLRVLQPRDLDTIAEYLQQLPALLIGSMAGSMSSSTR